MPVQPAELTQRVMLSVLERDRLLDLVDLFGVSVRDRRRVDDLRLALRSVPKLNLLSQLYEPEVKAVCAAIGVSPLGRRTVLVDRLSHTRPQSGSPPVAAFTPKDVCVWPGPSAAVKRRTFVALDFETANNQRDSACAVAVVRVESGTITQRVERLIRPPPGPFLHTHIHKLSWVDVLHAPNFGEVWRGLEHLLDGAEFIAAHSSGFERSVLRACCGTHFLQPPVIPYTNTVVVARQAWGLRPTKLNDVCAHLGIPLIHHNALSDAEACARIVLAAGADVR